MSCHSSALLTSHRGGGPPSCRQISLQSPYTILSSGSPPPPPVYPALLPLLPLPLPLDFPPPFRLTPPIPIRPPPPPPPLDPPFEPLRDEPRNASPRIGSLSRNSARPLTPCGTLGLTRVRATSGFTRVLKISLRLPSPSPSGPPASLMVFVFLDFDLDFFLLYAGPRGGSSELSGRPSARPSSETPFTLAAPRGCRSWSTR